MMARRTRAALVAGLVAMAVGPATAQAPAAKQTTPSSAVAPPEVALPGTQVLTIHSAITGQDYTLHVSLPRGYDDPAATFPVIYALDGQWDFTLVHAIYGQQYYDGFLPAAIVAGITWGGEKPDYDKRRAFDLTPTAVGQAGRYGNAAGFLSFIQKEAIPFVESRFRVKKDERTLTGSSFAGLFTLYALFHQPALFNRYVLTSPTWNWDRGVLLTYGEAFSKARLDRPLKVFMAVGEYEDVAGFEKLAATIKGYQQSGLDLQTKIIAGAGHSGAKAEGFTRGLQYVYSRPCASLEPKALQRLAGEYEVGPGTRVKIVVENGQLAVYPPDGQRVSPCAVGDLDFRIVGQFANVHFTEAPDKTITGFRLEQYSGQIVAKKVNQP